MSDGARGILAESHDVAAGTNPGGTPQQGRQVVIGIAEIAVHQVIDVPLDGVETGGGQPGHAPGIRMGVNAQPQMVDGIRRQQLHGSLKGGAHHHILGRGTTAGPIKGTFPGHQTQRGGRLPAGQCHVATGGEGGDPTLFLSDVHAHARQRIAGGQHLVPHAEQLGRGVANGDVKTTVGVCRSAGDQIVRPGVDIV